MKKNSILVLIAMMIAMVSCEFNDRDVNVGEMPMATNTFINDYFPGCDIVAVDKDYDGGILTYDVVLNCGIRLEFDRKGEWLEVDCEPNQVPDGIIPAKILDYVLGKYPDNYIVKIERNWYSYHVELDNDLELVFDKDANFKRIDN